MTERIIFPKCPNCNVNYPPWLENDPERCRCSRAATKGAATLHLLDPRERATLPAILSSIGEASEKYRKIVKVASIVASGQRKRGLGLLGDPGVGKTHLMIAMYREALKLGLVATWRNAADLVREVQDSYSKSKESKALKSHQIIESILTNDILFLDDLGKEKSTQDVEQLLYSLIDGLYQRKRTLVFSTNLSSLTLRERYDPALISRIKHMTSLVGIEGEDRRKGVEYG